MRLASFGRFQTGTSIQAPLFVPHHNPDACDDMTVPEHMKDTINAEWHGFVIVKDGGCTWEEKARRVEKMGAQGVIIIEDEDEWVDSRMFHTSESKYDGSGTSISIPTLLVENSMGNKLMKMVEVDPNFVSNVILKADIEISDKDSQSISYQLFYGSILDLDSTLLLRLYEYQHALDSKAIFIPRIITFECKICP